MTMLFVSKAAAKAAMRGLDVAPNMMTEPRRRYALLLT